jgi:hypothetical protein
VAASLLHSQSLTCSEHFQDRILINVFVMLMLMINAFLKNYFFILKLFFIYFKIFLIY